MPWSGRGGSAYSQMEIAEGRKLTTHKSVFVRFPLKSKSPLPRGGEGQGEGAVENEFLLIWTTTPWTLTSNVGAAVNTELDYVSIESQKRRRRLLFRRRQSELSTSGDRIQRRIRSTGMEVARRRRQAENDCSDLQGTGRL